MTGFHVVIPARYGSLRLPGKPLVDIAGIPMVVRVAVQASRSGAASIIVATDDRKIERAVAEAGYRAVLTRNDHVSGSDRVAEVVARKGWPEETIVVNVQGDEPLMPPAAIGQVAQALARDATLDAATLCEPISNERLAADSNCVKVVRDARNLALYFSRSPIPGTRPDAQRDADRVWLRHIGIYGYRAGALRRYVELKPGLLERAESLEQLRMVENGMRLLVLDSCCPVPGGVDTPKDLARVRSRLAVR